MKRFLVPVAVLCLSAAVVTGAETKPLRVLLVTGGCCHDYTKQKDILKKGIEERVNATVTQVHTEDRSTKAMFEMYQSPDWAKGYDAVIHDECSADVKDTNYVQNILNAHKGGVAAVNLHCAMHSYRTGTEDWFKFVGLQSTGHGPQEPIAINFTDKDHPAIHGFTNWTTIREELYNNKRVYPTARPLASGKQVVKSRDGKEQTVEAVIVWANEYEKGRVFSTTLAHNNATVGDSRYLDLVTRGLLWACGKIDDSGKIAAGYEKAK